MKEILRRLMKEFCNSFKLRYKIRYSESLTQREINAHNLLGSGELKNLLKRYERNYSKIDKEVSRRLKAMSGTGNLEASDVKSKNNKVSTYLKRNKELFDLLKNTNRKIIEGKLVDTIPIPVSDDLFSFLHKRQKISMMVHESIHYILEKNGINFQKHGLSPLDEGFCVFLHLKFKKYSGLYKYDNSSLTIKYRFWASFFKELLRNIPNDKIISTIRKYPKNKLRKMMKKYEKKKLM